MTFWRLHYHLVWGTYQHLPLLSPEIERALYACIHDKAEELQIVVHAVGDVEDHVHLAVSIPPKLSVADCVRHLKGSSSHHINQLPSGKGGFGWQDGYGALTFGDRAMEDVVHYVLHQKEHHAKKTIRPLFERMDEQEEGPRGSIRVR